MTGYKTVNDMIPNNDDEKEALLSAKAKGIDVGVWAYVDGLENVCVICKLYFKKKCCYAELKNKNGKCVSDCKKITVLDDCAYSICDNFEEFDAIADLGNYKIDEFTTALDELRLYVDKYMSFSNVYYYIKNNEIYSVKLDDWLEKYNHLYADVFSSKLSPYQLSKRIVNGQTGVLSKIANEYNVSRSLVSNYVIWCKKKYPELDFTIKKKQPVEIRKKELRDKPKKQIYIYISQFMKERIETHLNVTRPNIIKFWEPAIRAFVENPTDISYEFIQHGNSILFDEKLHRNIRINLNVDVDLIKEVDKYIEKYNQTAVEKLNGRGKVFLQAAENYLNNYFPQKMFKIVVSCCEKTIEIPESYFVNALNGKIICPLCGEVTEYI